MARRGRSRRSRRRTSRARTSRRRNTRTAQGRRAANRAAARSRAQASARKRVAARKAAGRKPSGANKAANRQAARDRAQAAATKRREQGRTIAQTKARNQQRMRDAAAERNRKFQAERAAAAKRRADAAAAKRRQQAAETSRKAAVDRARKAAEARRKAEETSRKAAVDRARKAAEARRPAEAAAANKPSTPTYRSRREGLDANQQRIANKPTGNPNVMSPDGTFNRPGPGGPEKEADYTSYQPGSFYNQSDTNVNFTNALRSTRNLITAPARALGINNQFTNRLIPKSNEAIQDARDQRGPRPTLTRRRRSGGGGSGGGISRIQQQAAAQQMQPEIAPTIGTPEEELLPSQTVPQGDLTRIQNQAYNTQLTSSLAGMFGGQGSVGYTPQGSPELSPTLRAGRSRGRRRVRLFGARRRRGGTGDQFSRAGDRIAKLTNINI